MFETVFIANLDIMKRNDIFFLLAVALFFLPFFVSDAVYAFYSDFNKEHGMIMSFIKFAVLATLGEVIGLRIRTGEYNRKGFGILPRAIVWGFLGLTIKMAFVIFASGVPVFLEYLGVKNAGDVIKSDFSGTKLLVAFSISTLLNMIYAPVMMTLHKITDTHIINNGGTLRGFFSPLRFGDIMVHLNWSVQWNFVFKKTIPFFWIPAHTITFLLPQEFRVLFAAFLGVALGVILAIAGLKSRKE